MPNDPPTALAVPTPTNDQEIAPHHLKHPPKPHHRYRRPHQTLHGQLAHRRRRRLRPERHRPCAVLIDIVRHAQPRRRFCSRSHAIPALVDDVETRHCRGLEGNARAVVGKACEPARRPVLGIRAARDFAGWGRFGGVAQLALEEGAIGGAVGEVAFSELVASL